jgi:hypothetical protein
MTKLSMRATFGNKFITNTGLEHPTQLRTPRGSDLVEKMMTPHCMVQRTYCTYCAGEEEQAYEFFYQLTTMGAIQQWPSNRLSEAASWCGDCGCMHNSGKHLPD